MTKRHEKFELPPQWVGQGRAGDWSRANPP